MYKLKTILALLITLSMLISNTFPVYAFNFSKPNAAELSENEPHD